MYWRPTWSKEKCMHFICFPDTEWKWFFLQTVGIIGTKPSTTKDVNTVEPWKWFFLHFSCLYFVHSLYISIWSCQASELYLTASFPSLQFSIACSIPILLICMLSLPYSRTVCIHNEPMKEIINEDPTANWYTTSVTWKVDMHIS